MKLNAEIAKEEKQLEKKQEELRLLSNSNKQLIDERRNIDRVIEKAGEQEAILNTTIQELKLENELTQNDLAKVTY